jgi:hypothetical protein
MGVVEARAYVVAEFAACQHPVLVAAELCMLVLSLHCEAFLLCCAWFFAVAVCPRPLCVEQFVARSGPVGWLFASVCQPGRGCAHAACTCSIWAKSCYLATLPGASS